jgi:hypothetical protein
VFCHVYGDDSRFLFFIHQRFFARQTKISMVNEGIFDPLDGFVNVTDDGVIFISKMFHRPVFPPVLKREKEPIFDPQFFRGLPAELVKLFKGGQKDVQHREKGLSFDTEKLFELSVVEGEGFLDSCGLDCHGRQAVKGKNRA